MLIELSQLGISADCQQFGFQQKKKKNTKNKIHVYSTKPEISW